MARKLRVVFGEQSQNALLLDHTFFAGFIRFGIPEFYGASGGRHFAIEQELQWQEVEPRQRATFRLLGDPAELGVEYHGSLAVVAEDEISWQATLKNLHDTTIELAHHTILLDMSGTPEFLDDYGEETYLFTDTGWSRAKDLLDPHANPNGTASFRIGAAYRGGTVLWRVIARSNPKADKVIGLALDRACAFALDHPHWSRGLLVNCRWPPLAPGKSKEVRGRIYLLNDHLDGLRDRYVRDFKERVVQG
ncbi:MAG: hypothetical protein JXB04_09660 [Kiritimatiellae bacterium]|nr:hypothetical protein [Kiritimatiellia bacterium]